MSWKLHGGRHPDSACVTNVLANLGSDLSEAMVMGIGGGLGAGYMLWEMAGEKANVILGFQYRWVATDWGERTLDRLGASYRVLTASSPAKAAAAMEAELDAGRAPIILPDRQMVHYWHLPLDVLDRARPIFAGMRRSPVIAYAAKGGTLSIDDRNLKPLTAPADLVSAARARLSSAKNRMVVVDGVGEVDLRQAVKAGIADCAAHLGANSNTIGLPAWRKWGKLLADRRNAKGWPSVFGGEGKGLVTALFSIYELVQPVGLMGGHLRDMYASFLDEAAPYAKTESAAALFRESASQWDALAATALPADVPAYAKLRKLLGTIAAGVAAGDAALKKRAAAATQLWDLLDGLDRKPPAEPDYAGLSTAVLAIYETEVRAVQALSAISRGHG
jgi:hypothetical protein